VQRELKAAVLLIVAVLVRVLVSPIDGSIGTISLSDVELSYLGASIAAGIGIFAIGWNKTGIDVKEVTLLVFMAVLGSMPMQFVIPSAMILVMLLGWIMHIRGRTVFRECNRR
jgi:hypothetical protein